MKKILSFFTGFILLSNVSCSGDQAKQQDNSDSVRKDTIASLKTVDTTSHSPKTSAPAMDENLTVASLLKKLPLLKFPLTLNVDSFKNVEGISVKLQKNIPWFGDFLSFPKGTKVTAIGKCYVDPGTEGILFFTSAPNEYPERDNDEELIMSLFEGGGNAMDSRIVSIKCSAGFGNSLMRNPVKGKSFEQEENEDIRMTFTNWGVKNGAFYETSKKRQDFPMDKKGTNESIAVRNLWMN